MESIHEQPVPLEEVHAQEDARKEPEIQKKASNHNKANLYADERRHVNVQVVCP
jgi:hypothetical protein